MKTSHKRKAMFALAAFVLALAVDIATPQFGFINDQSGSAGGFQLEVGFLF